jgi:putative Holliday junction resolvase
VAEELTPPGPGIPRQGRILAVDPGSVRVGLALSDPLQTIASPLAVLPGGRRGELALRLARRAEEEEAVGILVGLPVSLSGQEGPMAKGVGRLVAALRAATRLPVETLDERRTSQDAEAVFVEAGVGASARRGKVDMVAAALLLQAFLDSRRLPQGSGPW